MVYTDTPVICARKEFQDRIGAYFESVLRLSPSVTYFLKPEVKLDAIHSCGGTVWYVGSDKPSRHRPLHPRVSRSSEDLFKHQPRASEWRSLQR